MTIELKTDSIDMHVQNAIVQCLQAHVVTDTVYCIAYSGGLDSHVLLHAMHALKEVGALATTFTLRAVHVNHQLNPLSNDWAQHCKKICVELNIPLSVETIHIDLKPGDSLEENARNARYAILQKYITKNSVLLTAHNLNDQAETFLLQALRGAGSKGLSAMPMKKKFGEGFLIRPLLSVSRETLAHYARENNLEWIEDDSNIDPRFRRNFLRHEVFPILKKQYPTVMENFSRSARLLAHQEKMITEVIDADFEKIKTDDVKKIQLKKIREFSDQKQHLLLRQWFTHNNLRMPNEKHLKQIQKDVINAAPDAHPVFCVGNLSMHRDRDYLFLVSKLR